MSMKTKLALIHGALKFIACLYSLLYCNIYIKHTEMLNRPLKCEA